MTARRRRGVARLWASAAAIVCGLALPVVGSSQAIPAPDEISPEVRALAGCFEVTLGDWINPPEEGVELFDIPSAIRLEPTLADLNGRRQAGRRALHPRQGITPDEWQSWALDSDSLTLVWSTGFTGAEVRAAFGEDRLSGTLRGFTDEIFIGAPPIERPFTAVRVSCGDASTGPRVPELSPVEIWGAPPPLPSCYVPLSVPLEEPAAGATPWGDILLAMDTLVFEGPSVAGVRQGWVRPDLEGATGYWRGSSAADPRLRVTWGTAFSNVTFSFTLRGDTLVGEGRTPPPPGEPDVSHTRPVDTRPSGRLEFRALPVDCGPEGSSRLPGNPVDPITPAEREVAGCYAVEPFTFQSQPLEPALESLLSALGEIELEARPRVQVDGVLSPFSNVLLPILMSPDPSRRSTASWAVDADAREVSLVWSSFGDRLDVDALHDGARLVGTVEARLGPRPMEPLLGEGRLSTIVLPFAAERVPCSGR